MKNNHKSRYYLQIRNKDLFYFLNKDMDIPNGKKSKIVKVPDRVMNSSIDIKKTFLAGIFDTGGGFRGGTLGFTSASKYLIDGLIRILDEIGITHSWESWFNKKFNSEFYGIKIKKNQIDSFLNDIPIQNREKLDRIYQRFYMRKCRSGQTGQV